MKASKWMYSVMLALIAVLFLPLGLMANNIRILGTPTVIKKDDKKTAAINFTLAWDNSWKTSKPANWDAAWIYVKCWDGDQWNHAYLEESGHTPGKTDADGYRVQNRYKSTNKCPMTIKVGKSKVYKKWHVDPSEKADTGVVGVFLYRKDSLGSGNVVVPGISLLWNYENQGFVYDDDLVVKVFAVEMVYVPEGAFYLGGKGDEGYNNVSFTSNGTAFGYPFHVESEDSIPCTSTTDPKTLGVCGNDHWETNNGLPKAFPKGFKAFYIMKYELTQGAYAEFLNTLNQGQQNGCINGDLKSLQPGHSTWSASPWDLSWWRYFIMVDRRAPTVQFGVDFNLNGKRNETKTIYRKVTDNWTDTIELGIDGQDVALTAISFHDLASYADFAGLRPMTELEYEKACRGNQPVRNNEFAWGSETNTVFYPTFHWRVGNCDVSTNWQISDSAGFEKIEWKGGTIATGEERPLKMGEWNAGASRSFECNDWWHRWNRPGPVRVGMFADSTTTRAASGATYWGVMNMSDNCSELCIHAGYGGVGRAFEGKHGDGQLEANGRSNVEGWHIPSVDKWWYYIPRGMRFYNFTMWGHNPYTWNTRNGECSYGGYPQGDSHDFHKYGGTVSNRYYRNNGVYLDSRRCAEYIYGIRCVRTEDTEE